MGVYLGGFRVLAFLNLPGYLFTLLVLSNAVTFQRWSPSTGASSPSPFSEKEKGNLALVFDF